VQLAGFSFLAGDSAVLVRGALVAFALAFAVGLGGAVSHKKLQENGKDCVEGRFRVRG